MNQIKREKNLSNKKSLIMFVIILFTTLYIGSYNDLGDAVIYVCPSAHGGINQAFRWNVEASLDNIFRLFEKYPEFRFTLQYEPSFVLNISDEYIEKIKFYLSTGQLDWVDGTLSQPLGR